MARGKIYTNRKKTVRLGDENKKQSVKSKKDKKAAQQKQEKKPVATDVFDYRTGAVYSIRPEDTDLQLMEAKVTSFLKEKGAIEDPKDHLTTAVHLGDPSLQATPSSESPISPPTPPPSSQSKPAKTKMEKPEIPVTFWREVKDAKTNNPYYWNPDTNQTLWTLPENAVITSEASERSDKITDPENEDENADLTKAYAFYAKTLYGVETGEVKGNGVSSPGEENDQKDAATPNSTPIAKKNKKGKKQKVEDSPVAAASGVVSPEASNPQKNAKTRPKNSSSNNSPSVNSPASSKLESPILRLQVSNTSDELFRKLEYLHVTSERISDLQKLHIQLETRMEDWKEEELSSRFFLSKLKNASDEVNKFVQQEVPGGWTCVWDRASCRYYFSNSVSGEVCWEFPVANPDSVSSSVEASESVDDEKEEGEDNEVEEGDGGNVQDQEASGDIPDEEPAICQEDEQTKSEPVELNQVLTTPPIPPGPPPPPVDEDPLVSTEVNASTEPQGSTLDTEVNKEEEEEIEEVEMEESQEKSAENRGENEEMDIVDDNSSNDTGIAKADTPPMQLYDDIGPITNDQFDAETNAGATVVVEEEEEEEDDKVDKKTEAVEEEEPRESEPMPEQTTAEVVNDVKDVVVERDSGPESKPVGEKGVGEKEEEEEEGELNSDYELKDYRDYPPSSSKKQKKRSRYHSDSDYSYDGGRRKASSSSKRSRRHRGDDYTDSDYSDEYYSKSSSRRRSRSKDRGYYRSDSEERYRKKSSRSSHSKYGRDDSDNERYSSSKRSRKQRSRSKSRDHGSREQSNVRKDSKKKKKEKKKHRHRDSSSGDEYYTRKSKSKGGSGKDRDHDFSGSKAVRDPPPKEPPPPMEKAFVPAKFKPKGKSREDMDDSGLTATQLEMMQNIASVTGGVSGYMMPTYPMVTDPQYAATYYATGAPPPPVYDPNVIGQGVSMPEQPQTQSQSQQQPDGIVQLQETDGADEKVAEVKTSQEEVPVSTPSSPPVPVILPAEPSPVVDPPITPEVTPATQTANKTQDDTIFQSKEVSNGEEIMECEMELDDNEGELSQGDSDAAGAIEKAAKETDVAKASCGTVTGPPIPTSPPVGVPPAPPTYHGANECVTKPDDTSYTANVTEPTFKNLPDKIAQSTTVTGNGAVVTNTTITTTTAVTATPSTDIPAQPSSTISRDTTPPIQDPASSSQAYTISASSTTYSNPPTSYAYDPSQQAAYAAYTQQFYGNPYQYYTDPAQYAAAMNYYAAYQAAYTGTYGAYYQQQTIQQQQSPSQNPPGGQK